MTPPTSRSTSSTIIPTEDRSTAMKRFEAGELDTNDDLPTEQLADLKAKFGDQIRVGPYLGTYYYAIKTDKAPWDNVEAAQRHLRWRSTATSWPRRSGATRCSPAIRWCRPASRATRRRWPTIADKSQIDREDEAKKILDEARLRPRQAAEDGDPLQHVGEPQEHGGRHPGAAEAARHRGDAAQHRHQDALRPSRAEGRLSTWRAPAGSPTTRIRRPSSASRARRAATTTRTTTARSSRS